MEEDRLVLSAQGEIARRRNNMGEHYPFRIDDNGRALYFIDPVTEAGSVYLFCLFLSHAFDRTIVSRGAGAENYKWNPRSFPGVRNGCGGRVRSGHAMSFGFPRPDGADFLKALKRVYKLFGDGTPHRRPRAAAAKMIKDNGIDVIAWNRAIDGLPCTLYLVAQVASGADWKGKSVIPDREHFHKLLV